MSQVTRGKGRKAAEEKAEETPGLQQMLGAAGACPEIHCDGKVWKVGHPTQRAKAELERLAVAAALDEVRSLKNVIPPDAYQEMFGEVTRQITAKEFRTWGPGWQRSVFGASSAHLFLTSLLRECHPNATPADALRLTQECPEEVTAALAQVVPGFLSVLLAGVPMTSDQRTKITEILANLNTQPPSPTPSTESN